jgi:hypothetical protein
MVEYTFQMESYQGSRKDAAAQLSHHDTVRSAAHRLGPSRAYALFQVVGALAAAIYIGTFLFSFGDGVPTESAAGNTASHYTVMVLFPALLLGPLVSGARDRFSIRRKPSTAYVVAWGLVSAGFLALLVSGLAGAVHPWWMNLMVAVAAFVTIAAGSIRQLLRATTPDSERWANRPLSRAARWMTAAIGLLMGTIAATSTQPWFPFASVASLILLVIALLAGKTPWGLPRTGFEWGPAHWGAFGITTSALFALAVLLSRTAVVTTPLVVVVGLVVSLVMVLASVLPIRPRRRVAA